MDNYVLRRLQDQKRQYQSMSQKRTDLYITSQQLKEKEISEEIRKYLLEQDPQKIPDSMLSKPVKEKQLTIKFLS